MSGRWGVLRAISLSERRGVKKSNVPEAELRPDWGIVGDAHAGVWHRQVSLLAVESIEKMRRLGAEVEPGDFAENLTVEGLDLLHLEVGERLTCGVALLEVTQIGKKCHSRCAIFEAVGDCVMPREGVFARVVCGGRVKVGDQVVVLPRVSVAAEPG